MTDTAPVPRRSRDAVRQFWIDRLQRFDAGACSVADFCRAEGVATQTFYYWRNKLTAPACTHVSLQEVTPRSRPTLRSRVQTVVLEDVHDRRTRYRDAESARSAPSRPCPPSTPATPSRTAYHQQFRF